MEKREVDLGRFHYADEGMTLFAPILSGLGLVDIELRFICSSP